MRRYRKLIGNLLILAGAGMLIFWLQGSLEHKGREQELIDAFRAIEPVGSGSPPAAPSAGHAYAEEPDPDGNEAEGILSIPKIGLESPVLPGADKEQLDIALGAIGGLDEPGAENGSYAIAGHQSHLFGKFFNRLYEMEEGDRFTYQTPAEMQQYEVFSIKIVEPEDIHVLERKEGISLLSLVTCYPENSSRYRFIVQAKKIE